ncbi:ATP-dependent RecD-like DNA helicase [Streptomyces sp. YIM 130001]|uniref:DEAD/DEAH box helicase n=1 Tax=Streptomyces sp. YIM 130001 TaxID=2259644 RepID=UPI000EE97CD8|nr:DEAD/DEAH box helicase [Streptomyces sp. YIM 130001]RII17694.1 ATP-dependent RecD-like DNA helicase [Streptomyces sp. YIM 130001]
MAAVTGGRLRADVVRYWRAVELFSPQRVPPVKPSEQVYAVSSGWPLPWEDSSGLPQPRPKYAWQHTVYCGVFAIERVRDVLGEVFPQGEDDDRDGRVGGDSALMSFTVNQDGLLLKDSVCFSACAWAVGRTRTPGPDAAAWLDGFSDEADACERQMLALGDGKLRVQGGRAGPGGLLAVAGRLVADAATGGVVSGLGELARGVVGEVLDGVVGKAAQAAAGKATESLAQGVADTARPYGTDDTAGTDGEEGSGQLPPDALGSRPLAFDDIAAFTAWLAARFGVEADLTPDAARVKSVQVYQSREGESGDQGFLNSFIADDLDKVSDELAAGRTGRALEDYLTGADRIDVGRRHDVREEPLLVLAGLSPEFVPLGRWPSATDRSLVLSQQFAVNRLLAELDGHHGVFSVNGPPGTGKTTMLRDVIAALVTQRACALAELRSPQQAFGKAYTWRTEGYARTVRELKPHLQGYEMVVASANNGAVQNISDEIPTLAAVAEQWRDEARYLPEQASLMLNGADAWGAVAARLGNRKNRGEFTDSFWWGNVRERGVHGGVRRTRTHQGLRDVLSGKSDPSVEPVDWSAAVRDFKAARALVERLRDERRKAAQALDGLASAKSEAVAADREAATIAGDLPDFRQRAAEAAQELTRLEDVERGCRERRRDHQSAQPGLLQSLFTFGRANRTWQDEYERLTRRVDRAIDDVTESRTKLEALRGDLAAAEQTAANARAVRGRLESLERTVATARRKWGDHVPDPADFDPFSDRATLERRERSAPWADEEFAAARTRLFIEALRLHRAFLSASGDVMLKNLQATMEVVGGNAPRDLKQDAVRAAWQNLFLAVPVVSTTFASYDRLFAGLGKEDLGWLFVDEAGQAAPQMPVGALWRSRRAVLVGDPLQLEPVVVLPWTAQQKLRTHHEVAQEWAPAWTSAQQVADRLGQWGTTLPADLPDGSTEVWVGSPLRVHRRCDDPMFTISNTIAYDGLMVHGVGDRAPFGPPEGSFWWDVRSQEATGKWVPTEGQALVDAVNRLLDKELPSNELYVISPFRDVARRAGERLRGLVPHDRVGTVHTAQGKEADVVILVLGTHPDAAGSRRWAAAKPNLLNVAVSRAKRRLIVIGNRDAWQGQRHFSALARQLPYYSW